MNPDAQQEALRHRRYLIVALGLCLLAVFVSGLMLSRDTSQISSLARDPGTVALASATLLVYAFAILRRPGDSTDSLQARSLGLKWGVAAGCLWISVLLGQIFAILAAILLPLFAGALGAIRIGKVRGGTLTGFWCGVAGGLIGFVAFATVGDAVTFLQPDVENEIVGAGYFSVLMLHGLIYCPVAGTLGGLLGILVERTIRPSAVKAQVALDMLWEHPLLSATAIWTAAIASLLLLGRFFA